MKKAYLASLSTIAVAYLGVFTVQGQHCQPESLNETGLIDEFVPKETGLPVESCAMDPVVFENLDDYTTGEYVGLQSEAWTTWNGLPGTDEDALVSDTQAFSPPNSILIEGQNGPTDLVLGLGQQPEGNWYLSFRMYIPSGKYAYYNIQDGLPFNYTQWNLEVGFNAGNEGQIIESGTAIGNFSFPHDTWFQVVHHIDLDNDNASLIIDGVNVWNWQYGPGFSIGSLDFYTNANGPNQWYLDDIEMRPLTPCPGGAIICDGFEVYNQGPVSGQSAHWAPWSNSPTDDGMVQDGPTFAHTGCRSLLISDDGPDDQLLLLGDRTKGNYLLEWYMYIPEGNLGYYNLQKFQDNPAAEVGMQVEWLADGTATLDAGGADVAAFSWTPDTWMHIQHFIDLDNDWMSLVVDGVVVYQWPANWATFVPTGTKQLGAVEFFGNTENRYYLDDVALIWLPLPAVTASLNVDMSMVETVSPEGVHVAGNFQGWNPGTTPLSDNGDGTWSVDVIVGPNQTLEYKFINGNTWGADEGQPGTPLTSGCGVDDGQGGLNRTLAVGEEDTATDFPCFDYCTSCAMVAIDETVLSQNIDIFPNPASGQLNIRVGLPKAAGNLTVRLLNAFGQVAREYNCGTLQTASIGIDITDIPAGLYLLQVMDGRARSTRPLIVE
ncbi:MAG: T9SS type A sorting domain-containing protein [Lewinellaceae bacterium]|nr:T9SS type A sorting domain-containing protein [Lewinellaceae bacterium]